MRLFSLVTVFLSSLTVAHEIRKKTVSVNIMFLILILYITCKLRSQNINT